MAHIVNEALLNLPPQETLGVQTLVNRFKEFIKVDQINLTAGEPKVVPSDNFLKNLVPGGKFVTYGHAKGVPNLAQEIAKYESGRTGIDFKPTDVFIGPGGRTVDMITMQALQGPLFTSIEPFWPGYKEALDVLEALGGRKTSEIYRQILREKDFSLNPQKLGEQLDKLEELVRMNIGFQQIFHIDCDPGNPLALVSSKKETAERAVEYAKHKEVLMLHSDAAYATLAHSKDKPTFSIERAYIDAGGDEENLTMLFSASKMFAVPGWRIAAISTKNQQLMKAIREVAGRMGYNGSTPGQHAVAVGLKEKLYEGIIMEIVDVCKYNFGVLNQGLSGLEINGEKAFTIFPTEGGIYGVIQGNPAAFHGAQYRLGDKTMTIENTNGLHIWMIVNGFVPVNASGMSPPGTRDYLFRLCIAGDRKEFETGMKYMNSPTYPIEGKVDLTTR